MLRVLFGIRMFYVIQQATSIDSGNNVFKTDMPIRMLLQGTVFIDAPKKFGHNTIVWTQYGLSNPSWINLRQANCHRE